MEKKDASFGNIAEKISRREQKKLQSRKLILEAAVELFSSNGFKETSIAEIMNRAELGIGTFYNYFDSKEDILQYLLKGIIDELEEYVGKYMRSQSPSTEVLEKAVMHTAKLLSENRFVLPLFLSAAEHSALPEGTVSHKATPGFKQLFAEIVVRGQETGEFRRDISPGIVTEMFHSLFQTAAISRLPMSFEENVSWKLKLCMGGLQAEVGENK